MQIPTPPAAQPSDHGAARATSRSADLPSVEDGSLVSEYGLIAILGATITGVAISWAQGGAIAGLLDQVMQHVRALVGA